MQSIPKLTESIASTAFPRNDNICMKMRDVFGAVYTDEQFADLYPQRGQPAESPWRLALVSDFGNSTFVGGTIKQQQSLDKTLGGG